VRGDARSGKRTVAVFLGSRRTRILYLLLMTTAYALVIAIAVAGRAWAGLALLSAPLAVRAAAPVARRSRSTDLVPVLRDTAMTELVFAVLLAVGLAVTAV
jgi:1,4-dihydroxy-2-naphthoate octaprenyltransferase